MRIAVVHNLRPGGAFRRMYEHVSRMTAHTVCEFRLEGSASMQLDAAVVQPVALRATSLPRALRGPARYRDLVSETSAWRELSHQIRAFEPDVVYANPCRFFQAPLALAWRSAPSVYFCDEVRRIDYEPALSHTRNRRTRQVYGPLHEAERRADRIAVWAADRLVTNSQYASRQIQAAYGRRARALRLGVSAPFLGHARAEHDRYVLTVGPLGAAKGHDLAIEAARLSATRPGVVVVTQRTPEQSDEAALRRQAERSGVALTIRHDVSDEGLADLYRRAISVVYLARGEPLGLVSLEAQACGCPVIVADEGGLPETVLNGRTGWVVPRAALPAAVKIDELSNDAARDRMGAEAQRFASEWSWDASAQDLLEELEVACAYSS